MSIEQALLARAHSHVLAEKARAMVRAEAAKGCQPEIADDPLCLEPQYESIYASRPRAGDAPSLPGIPAPATAASDWTRLQVWISPDQPWDWKRSERFIKLLCGVSHRIGLEIIGNGRDIRFQLLCALSDRATVSTAFQAEFAHCELAPAPFELGVETTGPPGPALRDFYPPPPYFELLTRPDELQTTLYAPIVQALSQIPPPGLGIYQVLFMPVAPDHDWHHNVERLLDLEFQVKLIGGLADRQRYSQQVPSGDLRRMAMDVETKAHDDKPFYAVALRAAVTGLDHSTDALSALTTFQNLIQNGGRPLRWVTEADYANRLSAERIGRMLTFGEVYRPGFLANSWELTSLVHLPPLVITEPRRLPVVALETLPADPSLSVGTPIGICHYAGRAQPVCIPRGSRTSHVHLIGRTKQGKSTLLERIVLDDIEQGHGVAVLDPHGRLVDRLCGLIPDRHADRVIYADPGDPRQVLRWNPLNQRAVACLGAGRIADDILTAFKTFVDGWGDRLEHLLRHAIEGVMHLPGGSLFDVSNLLRKGSPEGEVLRKHILRATDSEAARLFWREDFGQYTRSDLAPPQHKLSKFLGSGPVSLMLSQPDSAFDLREVVDRGQILLVDLSTIGSGTREILGCFMLSLLHLTALSRSGRSDAERRPFHIHCDEAHRFVTDALEDLIAETRKFDVSLTLAHQFMSQFGRRKTGALSGVGSTLIFRVDAKDAQYLRKDLAGRVEVEDLVRLGLGQAIARIENEVVRVETPGPLPIPDTNGRDRIIAASKQRYYRPVDQVRRMIRHRADRWNASGGFTDPVPPSTDEEFVYDTF
jgi:hypothetical protein